MRLRNKTIQQSSRDRRGLLVVSTLTGLLMFMQCTAVFGQESGAEALADTMLARLGEQREVVTKAFGNQAPPFAM